MEMTQINLIELGSKFKSKNEVYRFLVTEADLYHLPQKECFFCFVREMTEGNKKVKYFC